MDFCPEQQEEDVGAGCIYRSAEFAVTCAARRVRAVHVFRVCLWGAVLSLTTRPDLGVGSWGCGAKALRNLSLLKLKMIIWEFTSGDTDYSFQMYCAGETCKRNHSVMGNNFNVKT